MSWDGSSNGVFATSGTFGLWSGQSPDGFYVILNGTIYDRHGHALGPMPWRDKGASPAWSADGRLMCYANPVAPTSGSPMRLDVAVPGQSARAVSQGFAIYADNTSYPVLACDANHDRAVVAVMPQGVSPSHLWVFRLSTGVVIRSIETRGWAALSSDVGMLALSSSDSAGTWHTTIERTDDGTVLANLDDFALHGFSADGSLAIGTSSASRVRLISWRTGRTVWSSTAGPYGGYRPEPTGSHVAIGLGFVGGSSQADVFIVAPDGSSVLLPEGVQAALEY